MIQSGVRLERRDPIAGSDDPVMIGLGRRDSIAASVDPVRGRAGKKGSDYSIR